MTKALGPQAIPTYHPLLAIETQALLKRVMDEPKKFQEHTRRSVNTISHVATVLHYVDTLNGCRYAGGLTLLVVYGYRVTSPDDPMLNLAEECISILTNQIGEGLGLWLVDIFPFCEPSSALHPLYVTDTRLLHLSEILALVVPGRRVQAKE